HEPSLKILVRLLCEIFVVAGLLSLGWAKPFRDWLPGNQTAKPPAVSAASQTPRPQLRPLVRAAPTPSGEWMWDPAHRSTLDRPAYDSQRPSQRYLDETRGRKYWIDGQGVRHYEQ